MVARKYILLFRTVLVVASSMSSCYTAYVPVRISKRQHIADANIFQLDALKMQINFGDNASNDSVYYVGLRLENLVNLNLRILGVKVGLKNMSDQESAYDLSEVNYLNPNKYEYQELSTDASALSNLTFDKITHHTIDYTFKTSRPKNPSELFLVSIDVVYTKEGESRSFKDSVLFKQRTKLHLTH